MKLKMAFQALIVLGLTAVAIFFILNTGDVDTTAPTQAEVEDAMRLLRNSLPNPRHGYIDFLEANQNLRGTTPSFSAEISGEFTLDEGDFAVYIVNVPVEGLYYFSLEYELPQTFNDIIVSLTVNGVRQFEEAYTVTLPVFWQDETKIFPLNRFGDETVPPQVQIHG